MNGSKKMKKSNNVSIRFDWKVETTLNININDDDDGNDDDDDVQCRMHARIIIIIIMLEIHNPKGSDIYLFNI